MKSVVLQVEGMSCGHCVNAIESALKEKGADAQVNLDEKTVTVTFDDSKISMEAITTAIEDQGYDVK